MKRSHFEAIAIGAIPGIIVGTIILVIVSFLLGT